METLKQLLVGTIFISIMVFASAFAHWLRKKLESDPNDSSAVVARRKKRARANIIVMSIFGTFSAVSLGLLWMLNTPSKISEKNSNSVRPSNNSLPNSIPNSTSNSIPNPIFHIRGVIGGEKQTFLQDPDVRRCLLEKHGIKIDEESIDVRGSREIVQNLAYAEGRDFLWVGNPLQVDEFKKLVDSTKAPLKYNFDSTFFYSPIVLCARIPLTKALAKQKLVKIGPAGSRIFDILQLTKTLNQYTKEQNGHVTLATWEDVLGAGSGMDRDLLTAPAYVGTTNPERSNSGFEFFALAATMLNNGELLTDKIVNDSRFTHSLGLIFLKPQGTTMQSGSAKLWDEFIHYPTHQIIACYEAQVIEYLHNNPPTTPKAETTATGFVPLYVRGAPMSKHPMITLTPLGERLLKALRTDPELKQYAWRHGFRTEGEMEVDRVLADAGIPKTLPREGVLPSLEQMETLLKGMKH